MTGILIDVRSKSYIGPHGRPHLAIHDLRLELRAGEFVCLVGPSGCGKTTLLNLVAGLDRQFDGSIQIDTRGAEPNIAYVFQNPRLLPWRTARENIELALADPGQRRAIRPLLQSLGIEQIQEQYPEKLSLGMSRRVALARAFAVQPDLLLMDEPFVSLDAPAARRIRQLLIQVWQARPHTVLFVTHDLREAIALADRLIFLTASPMTVAASIPVDVPRLDRTADAWIESFRERLLDDYPAIEPLT